MIKLIIFDWDDVFTLGSKEGYIRCLHETLIELGVKLDPEEEKKRILTTWGKHHHIELKGLLKENPHLLDKAVKIYEDKFFGNTFVSALRIIPGVIELPQRLKKNYILALATGMHPKMLKQRVMPTFKIPNVFSQIISSYEIKNPNKQKPHPFMIKQIMQRQNVKPNETIFVGDAKTDVLMARGADVTPVVVLTGHLSKKEAEELGVKYIRVKLNFSH